jgi:hypothetical protein
LGYSPIPSSWIVTYQVGQSQYFGAPPPVPKDDELTRKH